MPLIIIYHQIQDENDGYEVVGYYDFIDSSFIEEEDSEIEAVIETAPKEKKYDYF